MPNISITTVNFDLWLTLCDSAMLFLQGLSTYIKMMLSTQVRSSFELFDFLNLSAAAAFLIWISFRLF